MNNLLLPLAIVLLAAGCGSRPPAVHEQGDAATPVRPTAQEAVDPAVAARAYAAALFAGEPTDTWSTPGWAEELAIRPSRTTPNPVVITGTAFETVTPTTAEIIVTTDPPDAQMRVLLVLRSGTWSVRGHA